MYQFDDHGSSTLQFMQFWYQNVVNILFLVVKSLEVTWYKALKDTEGEIKHTPFIPYLGTLWVSKYQVVWGFEWLEILDFTLVMYGAYLIHKYFIGARYIPFYTWMSLTSCILHSICFVTFVNTRATAVALQKSCVQELGMYYVTISTYRVFQIKYVLIVLNRAHGLNFFCLCLWYCIRNYFSLSYM